MYHDTEAFIVDFSTDATATSSCFVRSFAAAVMLHNRLQAVGRAVGVPVPCIAQPGPLAPLLDV
jgi:hypothetical protein